MTRRELLGGGDLATWWLGDPTSTQARGADVESLWRTIDQRTDPLDVWVPTALGATVGVTYGHAEAGLLSAELTDSSHDRFDLLGR